jgi:tRNA (cytidine32/uridine32-2'-O)-methyltransferase
VFTNIKIVLVNTTHSGNIGGVARAMKNMGMSELVLVEPKTFPSSDASARAAGADNILDSAVQVTSLEEAIADCELVFATSARQRHIPWPIMDPREMAGVVKTAKLANSDKQIAVVFGREDRGLTNEELHLCQHHVCIPSVEEFSSLNIAAAAQVIAYELRMASLQTTQTVDAPVWGTDWDAKLASQSEIELMFEHFEKTMIETEFLDPKNPRQFMTRLRRLIMRALPDKIEVNLLRGMLTSISKYKKAQERSSVAK